jgi:hypothetical protein
MCVWLRVCFRLPAYLSIYNHRFVFVLSLFLCYSTEKAINTKDSTNTKEVLEDCLFATASQGCAVYTASSSTAHKANHPGCRKAAQRSIRRWSLWALSQALKMDARDRMATLGRIPKICCGRTSLPVERGSVFDLFFRFHR